VFYVLLFHVKQAGIARSWRERPRWRRLCRDSKAHVLARVLDRFVTNRA
jgi:predicted Fe-S protein YdhL (DUF1289 family)